MSIVRNYSKRATGQPHPVDIFVGKRLRELRTLVGLSQEKLGEALGLTFQQVQKYERGSNRVSASRLYEMAKILDVEVSHFFSGIDGILEEQGTAVMTESQTEFEGPRQNKRETLGLVRAYYSISDPKVRRKVYELARSLGSLEREEVESSE